MQYLNKDKQTENTLPDPYAEQPRSIRQSKLIISGDLNMAKALNIPVIKSSPDQADKFIVQADSKRLEKVRLNMEKASALNARQNSMNKGYGFHEYI